MAEMIVGSPLPNLCDIHSNWLLTWATNIQQDPSHPRNPFFTNLPSGRLRIPGTRTKRPRNDFFLRAVNRLQKSLQPTVYAYTTNT